jgi:hypothetical protein
VMRLGAVAVAAVAYDNVYGKQPGSRHHLLT